MTLEVLRHYTVDDRIINEYGDVRGTQIGRETKVFGGTPLECSLTHSHSLMELSPS
jgi:hypothetical protein